MQKKWHVNRKGETGKCSAKLECPFGGDDKHFDSREQAQSYYEQTQSKSLFKNVLSKSTKKKAYKFIAVGGVMLSAVSLVGCDSSIQINDDGDVGINVEGEEIWFETEEPSSEESSPSEASKESDSGSSTTSPAPDSLDGVLWQGEEIKPSAEEVQNAMNTLDSLIIVDELNRDGDYDRDEMFGGWQSGTVEGIQARDLPFAEFGDNGKASGGYMMDPYTGERVELSTENTADADTEHIVPLKEVVESERIVVNTSSEAQALKEDPQLIYEYVQQGESNLTDEEISAIENDPELLEGYYLDADEKKEIANSSDNLTMVSSSANRSRGDKDPGRWMPDYEPIHCTFIVSQIQVKGEYSLSVDSAEEAVMRDVLENKCS